MLLPTAYSHFLNLRLSTFEQQQKLQQSILLLNGPDSQPTEAECKQNPEIEFQAENHKEILKKNYKDKSDYFALELSKHYHERKLKR